MPDAHALVRKPSPCFRRALSGHPDKRTIDNERALAQHLAYVRALEALGVVVEYLPPLEHCPDGPFVEDTVLVFEDFAVVCPMREVSRREEAFSVLERIRESYSLIQLPQGCEMDGGDVLRAGKQIFVGLSRRTNRQAISALRERVPYPVHEVPVTRGLHLKSAVSYLGENVLLFDRSCVDPIYFPDFRLLEVAPEEGYSANVLKVGDALIVPAGYPKVKAVIAKENLFSKIIERDMSEFEKADGGLTCLSIFIQPGVAGVNK